MYIEQDFKANQRPLDSILPFYISKKKKSNKSGKLLNQSVSLAYFCQWNTKKNVYSVNKTWQREHLKLQMFI